MADGVVLHPDAPHAEALGERGRLHEGRESAVERAHRLTVEREPFLVAPERGDARADRLAVRKAPPRVVYRLERAEARVADRYRGGLALGAAATAAQRAGGERESAGDGGCSDGHRDLKQKDPGNKCRGRSLFSALFNVAAIRGKSPRDVN